MNANLEKQEAELNDEIIKCTMYLFMGNLDGATRFAQSFGGGSDPSLAWDRKDDDEARHFAYRCTMQAHRMMKPSAPKHGMYRKR